MKTFKVDVEYGESKFDNPPKGFIVIADTIEEAEKKVMCACRAAGAIKCTVQEVTEKRYFCLDNKRNG